MSAPYRVLTVCLGNICRSPMAEFMLRAAFEAEGLSEQVEVTSCGTSAEERGNPMDRRAAQTLRDHGVPDLGWSAHRARRFDSDMFEQADLILAADHVHDETLRRRAGGDPEYLDKIRMLRSFDPESAESGDLGMADPWYGGGSDFDLTYSQIERAVPGIVEYVRRQL